MPNILVAWQEDGPARLPSIAAAVAAGARTVRSSEVLLRPLEAVDVDGLRWCDGLVLGVRCEPCHGTSALEEWGRGLEPHLWDAVQGKFASVFVAIPEEVRKRTRAHDRAVRLLTTHGMLVTGFVGPAAITHTGVESPRHFHHEYERLGRFSAGVVHAWIDHAGNPHSRRILGSLVRATRRVPAMRRGDMAMPSAARGYPLSGISDDMVPNC